jgi:hypothetical protein
VNSVPSLHRQEEIRTQKQRHASMRKQLILVLGALLGGCLPAGGQTLSAPLDLSQKRFAPGPGLTLLAAASSGLPLTTAMPARPVAESPVRLPVVLAVVRYRNPSPKRPSRVPVDLIQTPFIRQARVSLVQLGSGRLRLDGFASAMSMKNVLDGCLSSVHPGMMQPRVAGAYGISLSFRLGRDASL